MTDSDWKEACNKSIAKDLIQSLEKLLKGEAKYYICSDKNTKHKKIVIEYNHENK